MPQGISWFNRFLREDAVNLDPITNNLDTRNPSYPYTSVFAALIAALVGLGVWRVLLTAPTTFWFDPVSGSDVTGIGTNARPWASPAPLFSHYDFGGQTVTLTLKNNATTQVALAPWTGGGALTIELNSKSITVTNGSAIVITGVLPGICTIQNGTLAGTGTNQAAGIQHFGGGQIRLANLTFGACTFAYISASGLGGGQPSVNFTGTINLSATAAGQVFMFFAAGGAVFTTGFVNGPQIVNAQANLTVTAVMGVNFGLIAADNTAWKANGHTITGANSSLFNGGNAAIVTGFNGFS